MLCTRCQQREARPGLPAEKRAKFEAEYGVRWPFPGGLCRQCSEEWLKEYFKSPETKPELQRFFRAVSEKNRRYIERWKENIRSAALKALDVADAIAGRL